MVRARVEVGPDGVLSGLGPQSASPGHDEAWLPALRKDRDEQAALLTAVAGVHVRGGAADLAATAGPAVSGRSTAAPSSGWPAADWPSPAASAGPPSAASQYRCRWKA